MMAFHANSEAATKSSRAKALEQLRSRREVPAPKTRPFNSHPSSNFLSHEYRPPAQSRDATLTSRYFGTVAQPTAGGIVLAPDSSPLRSNVATPSQCYPHITPAWNTSRLMHDDPLSRPTNFSSESSSRTHPQASSIDGDDDPRPRKRLNRSSPSDVRSTSPMASLASTPVPSSPPEVIRIKRKRAVLSDDGDSDFESPPVSTMSKPVLSRLTRGRRPSPPIQPPLDTSEKLRRLAIAHATVPPQEIESAFLMNNGDLRRTGEVLSSFKQIDSPASSPAPEHHAEGEVGIKARGRQSAIYSKRHNISNVVGERAAGLEPRYKPSRISSEDAECDVADDNDEDDPLDTARAAEKSRLDKLQEATSLKWFNEVEESVLIELAACSAAQAKTVISLRPFESIEDLQQKLSRAKGVSGKMYDDYRNLVHGYSHVDSILGTCEAIGADLNATISEWTRGGNAVTNGTASGTETPASVDDTGIHLVSIDTSAVDDEDTPARQNAMKNYIREQPTMLAPFLQLKDYQMIGLNWLNLLHSRGHSCILADEMGLGKTVQVIAFLAHLKRDGNTGPHLIIVPSSTLENWTREFEKFSPTLNVQTYYASQKERAELRHELLDQQNDWEVLITTYNLAQGSDSDRKFLKRISWETCIFDEGHVLKNFNSQRYNTLMQISAKWRLLLTGTPLQNNLQELVSLMNFILPELFKDVTDSLRAIFKVKTSSAASLLSHERVSRAKKMMNPFVLRRRKDQVLKELPKKEERIEWCEMTPLQKSIYREALQRSRKTVMEEFIDTTTPPLTSGSKAKAGKVKKVKVNDSSSNVLMDLRKAASHPMLFRRLYNDRLIQVIAKLCLKEPEFLDSKLNLVVEDMSVMTDAELHVFCKRYKSVRKHALKDSVHQNAGKITVLMRLLSQYREEGRRVLIFSQFTQILDILKIILQNELIKYLVLTGSTAVDERQSLVDEFNEDESIQVFLLSTKAGGMGINLTAASVVIIYDQDFNPHNDLQAADRAYRIGQKKDVDVVKLITRGTIEEDMLRLGATKLALDEAVAGDGDENVDGAPEREMRASLMSVLREQFEKEESHLTVPTSFEPSQDQATTLTSPLQGPVPDIPRSLVEPFHS